MWLVHRQVATPDPQVLRHVTQNVHKLQPLAEPHAIFLAQRFQSRQVRPAYLRPKLADATRDEVRITVEFGSSERRERAVRAALQIEYLPGNDGLVEFPNQPLVLLRQ